MTLSPKARRRARTFAMQAVYQWQIAHSLLDELKIQYMTDNAHCTVDWDFFHALLEGVFAEFSEYDALIESVQSRKNTHVMPVEKALMRLAIFELKNRPDVPYKVVIKEYVSLAEEFATHDGYRFVNGVLDNLAPRLRNPLL